MKKYTDRAKNLLKAGFWVAGLGHFDISENELAMILEFLDKDDFENIHKLYDEWSKERL